MTSVSRRSGGGCSPRSYNIDFPRKETRCQETHFQTTSHSFSTSWWAEPGFTLKGGGRWELASLPPRLQDKDLQASRKAVLCGFFSFLFLSFILFKLVLLAMEEGCGISVP